MGEAKAREEVAKILHEILVGWTERAILLLQLRKIEGKGSDFKRTLRDVIKAVKQNDDFDYLDDTRNIFRTPDVEHYFVESTELNELLKKIGIEGKIRQVIVRTEAGRECPDRIVTLTRGMIDFLLEHLQEKATDSGRVIETLADFFGDLEDAKSGRYELPDEAKKPTNGTSVEA